MFTTSELAVARSIHSPREALRMTVALAGVKHYAIARQLGLEPGHLSRILAGSHHLSEELRGPLQDVCANEVLTLYEILARGYNPEALVELDHVRSLRFCACRGANE